MDLLSENYLMKLPGAIREIQRADGTMGMTCLYTPHSLPASTAALLLDAEADIHKVQEVRGHHHIPRLKSMISAGATAESAFHEAKLLSERELRKHTVRNSADSARGISGSASGSERGVRG